MAPKAAAPPAAVQGIEYRQSACDRVAYDRAGLCDQARIRRKPEKYYFEVNMGRGGEERRGEERRGEEKRGDERRREETRGEGKNEAGDLQGF